MASRGPKSRTGDFKLTNYRMFGRFSGKTGTVGGLGARLLGGCVVVHTVSMMYRHATHAATRTGTSKTSTSKTDEARFSSLGLLDYHVLFLL
jgi:hypothetical protein